MNRRKPPISLSAPDERIDADAAPSESAGESTSVVYFGNSQQISEGFAIALRVMGFEAGVRPTGFAQSGITSDPEDS